MEFCLARKESFNTTLDPWVRYISMNLLPPKTLVLFAGHVLPDVFHAKTYLPVRILPPIFHNVSLRYQVLNKHIRVSSSLHVSPEADRQEAPATTQPFSPWKRRDVQIKPGEKVGGRHGTSAVSTENGQLLIFRFLIRPQLFTSGRLKTPPETSRDLLCVCVWWTFHAMPPVFNLQPALYQPKFQI